MRDIIVVGAGSQFSRRLLAGALMDALSAEMHHNVVKFDPTGLGSDWPESFQLYSNHMATLATHIQQHQERMAQCKTREDRRKARHQFKLAARGNPAFKRTRLHEYERMDLSGFL